MLIKLYIVSAKETPSMHSALYLIDGPIHEGMLDRAMISKTVALFFLSVTLQPLPRSQEYNLEVLIVALYIIYLTIIYSCKGLGTPGQNDTFC